MAYVYRVATLLALALPAAGSLPLAARQLPTPQQAQDLLRDPQMAQEVRQRLQASGLTSEQVRLRLRSAGYPESLLDDYLGPASRGAPATATSFQLAAIEALGLASPGLDSLPLDTGFITVRNTIRVRPSRVFGVDAFRRSTTQFLPTLAGPAPADYRLGPGDVLVLILTGDVELAHTLPVTREGFILIPQVGQIPVANTTLDQLREVLYSRLGRVYSGVRRGPAATTRFDVTVANLRVNQVYVVGEVTQPGAYQISALGTVLTALYAAGGVTDRANLRGVEVQRGGKAVAALDLYEYLVDGVARGDVRLETGDVVFVPVHGTRVQVAGAVVRPAVYELKNGETLADLLRTAGGFTPSAALRRIAVHRVLPPSRQSPGAAPRVALDVPLTVAALTDSTGGLGGVIIPPLALEPGDSIVIDTVPSLARAYHVSIVGVVNKPGMYPWHEGMTLRDLVLLARGPAVGADLNEAEIARLPRNRSEGQLAETVRVPLDSTYLFERDSTGRYVGPPGVAFPASGAPEVRLEPYDNVLVLRQPNFELQRIVTILGQVRYPGTYALKSKSDRLSELVQRAGGLTPQAYPQGVRFTRAAGETGRVNVDLERALEAPDSRDNILLQPSDSVFVPEYLPTVKVVGAVNSPSSVLYRQGEGLDYYLSAAGGFARNADKGGVSVRYANGETRTGGKFLFWSRRPEPGPGAEVFVPAKDPDEGKDWLSAAGSIAQILASTAAIIVAVVRL